MTTQAGEAEFNAELWIGVPEWPRVDVNSVERWRGVGFVEFQIAGTLCHHQKFMGLGFQVPRTDRLALLAYSYYGSNLPGVGNPDLATPLETVEVLRDRLTELDLVLDPVHYAKFAEAYLPIEAESAWRYAVRRDLPIFSEPVRLLDTTERELIGLEPDWKDAVEYLAAYWDRIDPSHAPPPWTAVAHYPNSD